MLDTSVLVPRWSRYVLQRLAGVPYQRYQPVWSEWIIGETWRVLTRERVERAAAAGQAVDWDAVERAANAMMRRFLAVMTTVPLARRQNLPPAWPSHPDPNDVPIWQTALLADAHYVVSHDLRSFPPRVRGRHVYRGIEYLTAIELVEQVLGEDAAEILGSPPPPRGLLRSGRHP